MFFKTKPFFLFALLILGLTAAVFFNTLNARPVNVSLTTLNGQHFSLHSLQGKPVIVTFWATDCESCLKEIPLWRDFYQRYHQKGLEIIAVAMYYNQPNHVIEFNKTRQLSYPIALDIDAKIANAFGGVRVTPTTFLLSPDGEIVWQHIGLFSPDELRKHIESFI